MKAICAFCGHANRANAQRCAQCGGTLSDAKRERFRIPWASWVPAIPVAALLWFQYARGETALAQMRVEAADASAKITAGQQAAARELRETFQRQENDREEKKSKMLADARLISGAEASERHAEEWRRRQTHARVAPGDLRSCLPKSPPRNAA